MFLKSQMSWNVVVPAKSLDSEGLMLQKAILVQLLDDFAAKKASKDLGFFLAVETLIRIGEGVVRPLSGDLIFPVDFSCVTFKMLAGEILEGVAYRILKHGVFLRCGPAEKVYVSQHKMGGGTNMCLERTLNLGTRRGGKIEKGTSVRFEVIAEKYVEAGRDFQALVSLEGDYLGPVA